jgi:hypothetical protein
MTMAKQQIVKREVVLLVLLYAGIIAVTIPMVMGFVDYYDKSDNQMNSNYDNVNPYTAAKMQVTNGELSKALGTYTKIIDNDESGSEESAWHEKGKILVRLGYCNEAMNHYSNYVYRFEDSERAEDGFDQAKQC